MSTGYDSDSYLDEMGQRLTVAEAGRLPDAVLVAVTGELDVGTIPAFRRRMSQILADRAGECLELDLSALEFCDLAGLRALHAVDATGAEASGRVRIGRAGPSLDVLMGLCRTPTILGYAVKPPSAAG